MSILNNYSSEEFKQIVSISSSFKDLARKLGYSQNPSGATIKNLQNKAVELNCNTSHFNSKEGIKRTEENVFCENSTASQATLRRWYIKGNYTPYVCNICGQEPIWQEKELTLILDHINGCNGDNRLENLRWVCPNCNQQLETTGFRKMRVKETKKYYCQDCGQEISKGSLRCLSCEAKARVIPLEDMLITREELKNLIRTKPFTQIGKQFGVSDNTIRKWCDKFNLPRKATDIKKFSDEDWSKI